MRLGVSAAQAIDAQIRFGCLASPHRINAVRLLSLDYDPVYDDVTRGSFASDVSVFDYDAVVWDPEGSFQHYTPYAERYKNLPSLSESTSVSLTADAARRRQEFLEFLNSGRSIVVVVRAPQACYVDTGERTYSGTGRNRVTTTHVADFDLWRALPVSSPGFERASGSRIEITVDGPIASLLKKYKSFLSYSAVMKNPPGSAVARVTGTDRIVSSVLKTKGGGWLIMIPAIDFEVEEEEEEEGTEDDDGYFWAAEAPGFQADLVDALLQLNAGAVNARPAWAESYATEAQQKLRDSVVVQQKKVENARARLTKLQGQKEDAEARDQLFLGTGRALELQVRDVLELLGGTVTDPEPGRDDWRVSFPEGDAVLEVKGVKKSAAEKHAAQLEKWVAGAYEETGTMPKGILAVNTWREIPLSERVKDDFPAQMIPYSKGRGHCLVTGLQLFLIRADVEVNPARAEYWRKTLLKAKGVLTKPSDWRAVIQVTETEEAT